MTKASEELLAVADRCERVVFPCPDDASATEVVEIRSTICQLITGRPYDAYSPDYIGSLDAAMTLVPRGWGRVVGNWGPKNCPHACVTWPSEPFTDFTADATTEALALCAAALRALANKATPHG